MFWDNWIPKKYLIKSTVAGVELVLSENSRKFIYVVVKNTKNKLEVIEKGEVEQLDALPKNILKNKVPVILNVSGKGVIFKKVTYNSETELNAPEFLQQNLPAINLDEFYAQTIRQENGTCFIAVIRKHQLDAVVDELKSSKFEIADVIIGPACIIAISPIIGIYNHIEYGNYKVELLNGMVESISGGNFVENKELEIGGIQMRSDVILPFSGAFAYLTGGNITINSNNALSGFRSGHLERNRVRTLIFTFVGIAFAVCLINFLFFSNYFSSNSKLQGELDMYQGKYEQVNTLLNSYERKKVLIEKTGLLENNFFAKYSDKIAATIPGEVTLTEFCMDPLIKNMDGEDTLMNFEKNVILMRGNCNKSLIINEWVNVIKAQNFVKDVNLEKFLFNTEGYQPNFEIKIVTE